MTEGMHTPGPWKESKDCVNEDDGWIDGPNGQPVVEYAGCGSHRAGWRNPKDKILALAAPELLDSLEEMVANVVPDDQGYLFIKRAKAAIAKARGENAEVAA